MQRPRDTVTIYAIDRNQNGGAFDAFTSVEIKNDLTAPSEASFEVGDDASFRSLESVIAPGSTYKIVVNGRLRLTGRVEADDVPIDAQGGATVRFIVRTKLADAAYASADRGLSIQGANLKDLVLRAYRPLGYLEQDFTFKGDVSRDLMTGRSSRGGDPVRDLAPMNLQQAKVNPPETIFEFVERHLLRFHLMHWDTPDGRIIVGKPNDQQGPIYSFRLKTGPAGRQNNLVRAQRTRDYSDAPSILTVFTGWNFNLDTKTSKRSSSNVRVPEVADALFHRPVVILDDGIHTAESALARALREVAARSKKLDAWELETDGWSHWDGQAAVPYGIDTVADVDIDVGGGSTGAYLVHRNCLRLDPENGFTAKLSLLKRGVWVL